MTPEEGFDKARGEAVGLMTGKDDRQEANTKYGNMSDKAKDKQAERVGINQFAKAGLGGAYGVWASRAATSRRSPRSAATTRWPSPAGGFARMETNLLELMDHIDATYRTRAPEMVDVVK
jgi:hypothetical protein